MCVCNTANINDWSLLSFNGASSVTWNSIGIFNDEIIRINRNGTNVYELNGNKLIPKREYNINLNGYQITSYIQQSNLMYLYATKWEYTNPPENALYYNHLTGTWNSVIYVYDLNDISSNPVILSTNNINDEGACISMHGNYLYIIGGNTIVNDYPRIMDTFTIYDTQNSIFKFGFRLNEKREYASCIIDPIYNILYVFGGSSQRSYATFGGNSDINYPSLPITSIESVFIGNDGSAFMDNQWTKYTRTVRLNIPRYWHRNIFIESMNIIAIFGGVNRGRSNVKDLTGTSEVEIFDIHTKTIQLEKSLPIGLILCEPISYDDRVFVFGNGLLQVYIEYMISYIYISIPHMYPNRFQIIYHYHQHNIPAIQHYQQ